MEDSQKPVVGQDGKPVVDGQKPGGGDQVMIPKSRFDEVNDKLQVLTKAEEKRKADAEEAEKKRLAEQGEFKNLAEKERQEKEKAIGELKTVKTQSAIERAAFKAGISDTEVAAKLIDSSKITFDANGNPSGMDEAIKDLLKKYPYLKTGSTQQPSSFGGGGNPQDEGGKQGQKVPLSQVKKLWGDLKFTRAKHPELNMGDITGEEYLNKLEKDKLIDYTK